MVGPLFSSAQGRVAQRSIKSNFPRCGIAVDFSPRLFLDLGPHFQADCHQVWNGSWSETGLVGLERTW